MLVSEPNIKYRLELQTNARGVSRLLFQVLEMNEIFRNQRSRARKTWFCEATGYTVNSDYYPKLRAGSKRIHLWGSFYPRDTVNSTFWFGSYVEARTPYAQIQETLASWSRYIDSVQEVPSINLIGAQND